MFYFAYGGNTNPFHIAKHYPNIKLIGKGYIKDYKLVFRKSQYLNNSYCDIERDIGSLVYGVIYSVEQEDIDNFDIQEYVDVVYERVKIDVMLEDDIVYSSWIYTMINKEDPYEYPSQRYYKLVSVGYKTNMIPYKQLIDAINLIN